MGQDRGIARPRLEPCPYVMAEPPLPRLVIVEPGYASTVGHHGEVNRSLLAALAGAWQAELWTDVALEAEPQAPQPLRGVFSGCGYEDPRLWSELGGMVQLARRLEQQLALASAEGPAVRAWLGHSLLPFQLLGLARHLTQGPPATVLVSLMHGPGETLGGGASREAATANCRVALAALARAAQQGGHRLRLTFPSRQQEQRYAPLLAATQLASGGVHPAVVGGGCRPEPPPAGARPLVLLHWGDCKAGKGRAEALAVLEQLLEQGPPPALAGWGWLFHSHGQGGLAEPERELLQRVEAADLGLDWRQGEVASAAMGAALACCPLALLAYDPELYRERSSGMLWQWAASRLAVGQGAVAVGHGGGWLAAEAAELGVDWRLPMGGDGRAWLAALAEAAPQATATATATAYGRAVLGESFGGWCGRALRTTAVERSDADNA